MDAISQAVKRAIDDAHKRLPPNNYPDSRVFRLCQFLRSATTPDKDDSADLEPYLLAWHNACKDLLDMPFDVVRGQFHRLWDHNRVKYAADDFWQGIIDQAHADIDTHSELDRYTDQRTRFLALCLYHASRATPGHTFYIRQADAGRIMGVSQRWAGDILALLSADGLIQRTFTGHTGKASEYRWID